MNCDEYGDRLATVHHLSKRSTMVTMAVGGRTHTFLTDRGPNVDQRGAEARERNGELRRLIFEQGEQLRALRRRLDEGNSR